MTITAIDTSKMIELGLTHDDMIKVQALVENTPPTRIGLDNFGSDLTTTDHVDDILTKANSDDLGEIGKKNDRDCHHCKKCQFRWFWC